MSKHFIIYSITNENNMNYGRKNMDITYENRYVAFLDILGFKNMVLQSKMINKN